MKAAEGQLSVGSNPTLAATPGVPRVAARLGSLAAMAESIHVIKPQPPVRAFVTAAVADLVGAVVLVAALSQGWHVALVVLGALLLVAGVGLLVMALVSMNRFAARFTLTDDGYRLVGPGVEHSGEWADVSKVTQSQEGSHVTIYHGAVRRTHLLFPGGDRAQIDAVLADIRARLQAAKG